MGVRLRRELRLDGVEQLALDDGVVLWSAPLQPDRPIASD
jgi:hypothetical protein